MAEQRSGSPRCSRRRFLRATGVAGIAGLAGCRRGTAETQSPTVAILGPGSLQNALANGLAPAVDVPVQIETHGSATLARMIDAGQRDPDIVIVADSALFENPLTPPWHSIFASNSIVIVYNPNSAGGQRVAAAGSDNWYEPLADGNVSLGRTDPDLDPLGYRTRFMIELASRYYGDVSTLSDRLLRQDQIYPETGLLSQFETGAIDAAVAYRNMAVERGYEYIELPDQINLSDPAYVDDWYSTTSYTLPSGQEIRGGLISYASTIRQMSEAAVSVFDALTTGDYLAEHGFLQRERFPAYTGDVPQQVREATSDANGDQSSENRLSTARSETKLSPTVGELTVLL